MSDHKLWTDGKDVFVVPVKELPKDQIKFHYNEALEAAKQKHSVRVENGILRSWASGMFAIGISGQSSSVVMHAAVGTLYDLPEGYRIARMRDCKRCGVILDGTCKHTEPCDFMMPYRFPPNAFVFHILPVEKQQSEDELWSRVEDLAYNAMADYMGNHSECLSGQLAYNIREAIRTEFDLIRRS